MNKIEIEKINTSEAEKNFSKLLEDNKTIFLNGTWGSGKSEFIKNVDKRTHKKMIYLDLWNVRDNRSVMNIAFYKLSPIKEPLVKILMISCIAITILMSDVVNLGLATRFKLPESHLIFQLAGIIVLFVSIFQFLKIKSDNIFVHLFNLLPERYFKNKILIIDDFDRVEPSKQEEAYKLFNIINGKLPIVFLGDYSKIVKNEDNFLQKIIDRQIELPFSLHPRSIWKCYFEILQEELQFTIDKELKEIFIHENRNLREQQHFNDYVNLEFFEKNKFQHVQENQQLFLIYLYLFHKEQYQLLLSGWFPEYKLPENEDTRTKIPGYMDNATFKNHIERVIDYVLSDTDANSYLQSFLSARTNYYIFENVNNLSESQVKKIIETPAQLRKYLISKGKPNDDFYHHVTATYKNNDIEYIKHIEKSTFRLLQDGLYSPLILWVSNEVYQRPIFTHAKAERQEFDRAKSIIVLFETNYLNHFDLSQKIHFFINIFSHVDFEFVYRYYFEQAKEIFNNDNEFSKQSNKPYLLSFFSLNEKSNWIDSKEWSKILFIRIDSLNDMDFVIFWSLYRVIDLDTPRQSTISLDNTISITIWKKDHDPEYQSLLTLFEERLLDIAQRNKIPHLYKNTRSGSRA